MSLPPIARRVPFGLALAATGIPMFMATLDNLVVTNALPVIHEKLGASVEQLQWLVNAYTLSFASLILFAVALGDRLGRRTVFAAGIAIFTLASVFAALSTDPTQLIVARAVQGLGGAAIMPLSLSLLAGSVEPRRRPLAIGIWGGIAGLGVAAGPLIGGAVVEGWNWQAIFWINVPVGILAIPLALLVLPNALGARARLDVPGVFLAGLGVLGIVFGIVRGNDAGWDSMQVVGSLIAGAVLIAAFLVWESRTKNPLLPLRLFRDRSFTIANVVGFGFSFGMFGAVFILIQYLQVVQGASPLEAAIQTTPWTMAPMIVAPLAGIFAGRIGTRNLIVAGLLFQTLGLGWLAATMSADTPYLTMLPAFICAGIGMGLVFAPSSTAVLANIVEADSAKATGTNSTLREIGIALGIAVMTAIFTGAGGQLTPTGYVDAAIPAVAVGAVVMFATAIVALFLPAGRTVQHAESAPLTREERVSA
ncbi:MAG: DHA2 family efflux MFS transporter permease subunit [Pseudolysinimonas sp.]|uniref:DHA2 family efflux MFS transporter permease subunit n=1 Tax=Pseudolysinimonas sp. TaxID=2680009 RepID=UPI003264A1B9